MPQQELDLEPIKVTLRKIVAESEHPQMPSMDDIAKLAFHDAPRLIAEVEALRAAAASSPLATKELERYMPVAADLKSCPFCGEKAVLTNVRDSGHSFAISCVNEFCWRPRTDYYDAQDSIVELWNRRASSPGAREILRQLRESLRSGLLFGMLDEPLDEYGKRLVRVIVGRLAHEAEDIHQGSAVLQDVSEVRSASTSHDCEMHGLQPQEVTSPGAREGQLEPTLEGNWHAIEGPNGMCACGTEKGGCPERLATFIRGAVDFWKAKALFLERERDAAIEELPEAFAVSKGSLKAKVCAYREFVNAARSAAPGAREGQLTEALKHILKSAALYNGPFANEIWRLADDALYPRDKEIGNGHENRSDIRDGRTSHRGGGAEVGSGPDRGRRSGPTRDMAAGEIQQRTVQEPHVSADAERTASARHEVVTNARSAAPGAPSAPPDEGLLDAFVADHRNLAVTDPKRFLVMALGAFCLVEPDADDIAWARRVAAEHPPSTPEPGGER